MTVTTVRTACHTAHLEPFTGTGVLVLPSAPLDAWAPSWDGLEGAVSSLHDSDLRAMLRELLRLGYLPVEPEDELEHFEHFGVDAGGRQVVMLWCPNSFIAEPSLAELAEAEAELSKRLY